MSELNHIYHQSLNNIDKWVIVLLLMLSFTGISVAYIGKAMLTPFHLLMAFLIAYGLLVSSKKDKFFSLPLFLFLCYVIVVNLIQFPAIRYTSILYTLIYGLEITILFNLLTRCSPKSIMLVFKWIVYLYCLNIVIGYFLDVLHIHISVLDFFIKIYYLKEGGGRPMGFSSEPSYATFIVSTALLCYSYINKYKLDNTIVTMFICVFVSVILSRSAYGFLFLGVVVFDWLLFFFKCGNRLVRKLYPLMLVLLLLGVFVFVKSSDNEAVSRLMKVTTVVCDNTMTSTTKMLKLQAADASAFARLGPTYLLLTQNDFKDFIIGNGAGASGVFLANFLRGIIVDEGRTSVDVGIIPALFYDYGFIGFVLFFVFIYRSFNALPFTFWLLFILILPNANINTQLIWFCVLCFMYVNFLINSQFFLKKS